MAVPDRVDADQEARQHGVDERRPAADAARREQQDDADGDRRGARERERPRALAEHRDRAGGREDRARCRAPAGTRARGRRSRSRAAGARSRRCAPRRSRSPMRTIASETRAPSSSQIPAAATGTMRDRADEPLRPHEGRAAGRALGQRVPARVREGGDEHEREGERRHPAKPTERESVPCRPTPGAGPTPTRQTGRDTHPRQTTGALDPADRPSRMLAGQGQRVVGEDESGVEVRQVHLHHGRSRLVARQGHHCRLARHAAEGARPQGRRAEARPVHQRRPGHDVALPARRGLRHRGRGRDRPRPRPLRALHRREHVARLELTRPAASTTRSSARSARASTSARPCR